MARIAPAQDPEFPKEFIMHHNIQQGLITNFHSTQPEFYQAGLYIIPQYSIVKNLIRGGVIAGAAYAARTIDGYAGPTVSIKIKTLMAEPAGSLGNIHLRVDHLWGTGKQTLAGGGVVADLANRLILGLHAHRDYKLNQWWFQNSLAFRISKLKKSKQTDL